MTRVLPLPLILSFTMLLVACGGGESSGDSTRVQLGRLAWSHTRAVENPPTRDVFVGMVEKGAEGLKGFPGRGISPKMDVQGLFDRLEDEATIVLTGKVRGKGIKVPVEARVVARGQMDGSFDSVALLTRGIEDLMKAMGSMFRIYGGGKTIWVNSLQSAEADEQILAIRLIGAHGETGEIGPMAALLTDPREQVAEAAAEALAKMGDKKAVPLIIESISRGDLRSEVRAIETLSKIGGNEARAYLEMTAMGHEIPEVRKVSEDALKRMKSL